jgi:uncharacterized protein
LESRVELLGIVVGQTKPHYFHFLAKRAISMGEYVTVDSPAGRILGLTEDSTTRSDLLDKMNDFPTAFEAKKVAMKNTRDKSYNASVKVVGLLDQLRKGKVVLPSLPPEPGSEVFEARGEEISEIFDRKEKQWAPMGKLLRNSDVNVSVNMDKVASRHLAILSVTGSGKSNLLALIVKQVAILRGTMVVFDYHGEYSELDIRGVVHAEAKINPRFVTADQLADLCDMRENAEVQRTVLGKAFTDEVRASVSFWDSLVQNVKNIGVNEKQYSRVAPRVEDIIQVAVKRMKAVVDPGVGDVLDQIKVSKVNILNMLEFTERQANAAISYYLEEILDDRKRAMRSRGEETKVRFRTPIICAIEEAHAFIPAEAQSDTAYIASKVAREGRKFGMSLIVVSQRPRRVSQDVLSQMGSFAIMKLTNPEDQTHVTEASEAISEDLLQNLPSLNTGEAVLIGEWVNIPSVVKLDHVVEKKTGADISATALWAAQHAMNQVARESTKGFMDTE